MTATSSGAAAELIVRQRLLDRLDELTEKPLTLIRGPVSSGKTTLLRQWSESFERGRLASLQVRDGTAHGLLSDLLAELGDGQSQGGSGASRQVVEGDLVAGLAARLASHGPIWILVDDRDFLLSADQLAMLEELSNLGSGALHLVLASRQLPDTPFGRYAVDDVGWLDADELRLTADELAELVALNGRGEVGPEALSEMLGASAGLVGVVALALRARGDEVPSSDTVSEAAQRIISEHVLAPMPVGARNFLLEVGSVPELLPEICDEVLGRSDSRARLDELVNLTSLVELEDPRERVYRVHPLLRVSITSQVTSDGDVLPAESRGLLAAHVSWRERQGHIAAAVSGLINAGDVSGALSFVGRQAASLVAHRDLRAVVGLISELPMSDVAESAAAAQTLAILLVALGHVESASKLLDELAARELTGPAVSRGARAFDVSARAALGVWQADPARTLACARDALELLGAEAVREGSGQLPDGYGWALAVPMQAGADALAHLGRPDEARRWLHQCLELSGTTIAQQVQVLGALALLDAQEGNLTHALESGRRAIRMSGGTALRDDMLVEARLALAEVSFHRGQFDSAERQLALARVAGEVTRPPATIARLLVADGHMAAARGRFRRGLQLFDSWRRQGWSAVPDDIAAGLAAAEARLALSCGQYDYARRLLTAAPHGPDIDGALASLYLAEGDYRALARHLDMWPASSRLVTQIEYQILRAVSANKVGDALQRRAALIAAARLGNAEGMVGVYVIDGGAFQGVLASELASSAHPALAALQGRLRLAGAERTPGRDVLLSERERQVIGLLAGPLSGPEIAESLGMSLSTLKSHQQRIYRKLKVRDRAAAVAIAHDLGLLTH